ncbi:MAG: 50S ribosomal protein L29 [Gemmatimonadetes bacterium]|nr:50S ribosomal protein L29 [Gemmatimonadota bacterium]
MNATQMREMTPSEISTRIDELERERFNLRFRGGTQPLDDPLRLRVIRRELARLKTVLRESADASTGASAGAARTGGK